MKKWGKTILLLTLIVTLASPPGFLMANTLAYSSDFGPIPTSNILIFSDVPDNHWAFDAIQQMVKLKIIKGYPDGLFRPDKIVTRAEFAKIMVSALGIKPTSNSKQIYSDVPEGYWASPYINAVKSYMIGYKLADGNYVFKPDDPVEREDVAVALVKYKGYDVRIADESILDAMFSDVDAISTKLKGYVALAVEHKFMSGFPNGTFGPQDILDRAQAATLLFRVSKVGNDNKIVDISPSSLPQTTPDRNDQKSTNLPTVPQAGVVNNQTSPQPTIPYKLDAFVIEDSPIHTPLNLDYYVFSSKAIQKVYVKVKLGSQVIRENSDLIGLKVFSQNDTVASHVYVYSNKRRLSQPNSNGYYELRADFGEVQFGVTNIKPETVTYEIINLSNPDFPGTTAKGTFIMN